MIIFVAISIKWHKNRRIHEEMERCSMCSCVLAMEIISWTVEQFIVQEVVIFHRFFIENIQNCHKITINFSRKPYSHIHTHRQHGQIRACIVRALTLAFTDLPANACTFEILSTSSIILFTFDLIFFGRNKTRCYKKTQKVKEAGKRQKKEEEKEGSAHKQRSVIRLKAIKWRCANEDQAMKNQI